MRTKKIKLSGNVEETHDHSRRNVDSSTVKGIYLNTLPALFNLVKLATH